MAGDRDALAARLRLLFLDELDEHVRTLDRGLVALERRPPADEAEEIVHELFRAAHTLKGAAQSAGIGPLGDLLHTVEETLARLRDRSLDATSDVLVTLFTAADAIAAAGRRLKDGAEVPGSDIEAASRALGALEGAGTARPEAPREQARGPGSERPAASSLRTAPPGAADPVDRGPGRMRVPVARLEALLNQAGEVLLASRQVDALARELTELTELTDATGVGHVPRPVTSGFAPAGQGAALPKREDSRGLHRGLDRVARSAAATSRQLSAVSQGVADSIRRIRMLSLADGFHGVERAVHDVARTQAKDASLTVEGGDVEVERPILEAAREAILHLIRNAVDHGIEMPGERAAAGKPAVGSVTVRATLERDSLTIAVSDDGRGFDTPALRAAADRAGVGVAESEDGGYLIDLAFLPGVSTARALSEVSGRGVGLDAVRSRVEGVGGTVRVESEPGRGSLVVLTLPLAMSAVRVLFVSVAGETVGLPSTGVSRLLRAAVDELRPVAGREILLVGDRSLPSVPLGGALGFPASEESRPAMFVGVVVGVDGEEAILTVDALLGEHEVVMKPIAGGRVAVPGVLGATILETGRVAVVLNPATCVRAGMGPRSPSILPSAAGRDQRSHRSVLLAEDSFTTRALERSILEAAGYHVVIAVDGAEAWQLLQDHEVDIVVSDVDMPRMDGFALCDAVKRSGRFRHLPVVLVTSLGRDADRRRGIDAGADAYIVKSDFEQAVLLDVVERLL